MNRFLYFLPGATGVPNHASAADRGLAYAFPPGCPMASLETAEGPGGLGGILIAHGDGLNLKYSAEHQIWQRMGTELAERTPWIGMPKEVRARPAPEELTRDKRCLDGYIRMLGDNREWLCPIVRTVGGRTTLPCLIRLDDKGNAVRDVKPEWAGLINLADDIFKQVVKAPGTDFDAGLLIRFAGMCLGVNYRVSPWEVSMLGLIDDHNVRDIADALLDGPNLRDLMDEFKKKVNEASNLGVDSEAGTLAPAGTTPPGLR